MPKDHGLHDHASPPAARTAAPAAAAPLLRAEGVAVAFGGRRVLDRIDLAVAPGEIVTLIGPNGAGKSTLVKVVLGLVRPDRGTVVRRPGLRIGYMPQRLHVDATMPLTVRRFLTLWGAGRAQVEPALAEVGAGHVADSAVQALSGGEWQRVLLARALLRDPDLLVLDEPVQSVDVQGQADLFALIDRIRARRGCGVLLVSHDLHLVMARTDRVLCLNGHVCCSGRPEDVSRHPEYLALFGQAAAALALYSHRHDHTHEICGDVHPPHGHHHHDHGGAAEPRA
ncbi:MAG TPA: zinc ABC transporter ATP-binding protein ZnuC [Alphaproteobacteria bacterium]|nr:zinc ABC transporter ATP-binding protein ZnuC [Alphaproteobacteria bacterium]